MPNLCTNFLKVIGNQRQLNEFKLKFLTNQEDGFSFNSIIPQPQSLQSVTQITSWRNSNWDTKWDASVLSIYHDQQQNNIQIVFDTAQNPPDSVIRELSRLQPNLHIKFMYEEPVCNFAGYQYYYQNVQIEDSRDDYYTQEYLDQQEQFDNMYGEEDQIEFPEDPGNPFATMFYHDSYIKIQNKVKKNTKKKTHLEYVNLLKFKQLNKLYYLSRKSLIRKLSRNHLPCRIGTSKSAILKILLQYYQLQLLKQNKCSICLTLHKKPVQTTCGHIFCEQCLQQWYTFNKKCPLCRHIIN